MLDWVEQPRFLPELLALVAPIKCRVTASSVWQPVNYQFPDEAKLDSFGPRAIPDRGKWESVREWWLGHQRRANTPNWDIALGCEVEDKPGFILVEAKANLPELSEEGKRRTVDASVKSSENHEHIRKAIADARDALSSRLPGISIDINRHYQLSNRIAFAWKLASLGVPTVLVYLGFTGDTGIENVGAPFTSDQHWQETFYGHLKGVCPSPLVEQQIDVGPASFWLIVRSRPVFEPSLPVI